MKKLDTTKEQCPALEQQVQQRDPPPEEQAPDPSPQAPAPDCPPQGPAPEAPQPPDVPQGPAPNTATCPGEQKQEGVPARGKSTKNRGVVSGSKNKRKKPSIDCEQVFADVQKDFMQESPNPPPLLHTPYSLFSMLCDTFEQEFPNRLPRAIVDQVLLILQEEQEDKEEQEEQ
jgi:hypothetical protein